MLYFEDSNNDLCYIECTHVPYCVKEKKQTCLYLTFRTIDGDEILIEGCENACKSATTTWESMVSESNHSKICIIGHSYGGVVSLKLADKFGDAFQKRVFAILLTDSAHFGLKKNALAERCINFVASDKTLDTDLGIDGSGIRTKSAGHQVHEWTPSSSRTKLFEAFDHLFKQFE